MQGSRFTFLTPKVSVVRLGAACLLAVSALHVDAQSIQGSVIGTVRDKSQALVPNAAVTLTNLDTGTSRQATTDANGTYRFIDVTAGRYTVAISAAGFDAFKVPTITLSTREQLRVDAALAVVGVQQSVDVSTNSVATINSDDPSISAVHNSESIANLPTNTRASSSGTSALSVVGTLPGVQSDPGGFSLQGGLPFQSEVSVDGITVQNAASNSPISDAFPSSESISEMRADGVQNNAEFGQPGEITVTTKGGGNKIHGSAFWYHQNAAFNAIPYTAPTTTQKTKLVANTFGGSFSGPVVLPHIYNGHDRSFFFAAFEGWRYPATRLYQYKVPSVLMKKGDFSRYTSGGFTSLVNPFTGGSYGTVLPGVNAAAQKLLQFFPDPNVGDPNAYTDDTTPNFQVNKDNSKQSNQFDIRGDQYIGSNQKFLVWGRFTWKNGTSSNPKPLLVPNSQSNSQSRVLKISANYSFTPNLINEFGFGFTRYKSGDTNSFDGKAFTTGLGLNGLNNLFYNGLPEADFNNLSNLDADRLNSISQSNTYDYSDTLTWAHGRHQMKFGMDIRTIQAISPLGFNGADNYGTFTFNNSGSAGLFTGVDFADFLMGLPNQTFYDVVQQDNDGTSTHYHFFAQDQWAATPDLTISYGIRYELHPGYSDAHGDIGNFDPSYAKSGAVIYPDGYSNLLATSFLASANACTPYGSTRGGATINGASCMPVLSNSEAGYPAGLKHYPKLRFMPRFGFAWRPFGNNNTAIRGGYGIYNITLLGGNFYSLTGTLQAQTTQYSNTYNAATHAIGYQWPDIYAGAGNGGCTTCYGQGYFGTANSTNWKDPYTQQWSLSVDRAVHQDYALRLSYIGSITRQLVWAPDENTLPFSSTVSASVQPLSARLFPNWGRIYTRATGANAYYQSAQVEFSHRYRNGLQFDTIYTLAKNLADNQGPANNSGFAGETGGARATSILDRHVDYGNAYGTRRHLWNTTMVYDLPFGRGRRFGSNISRAADLIFGGWQISNILLMESGPYLTPYFPSGQGDPSGTGSGLESTESGFDGGHHSQYADRVQGVSMTPAHRTRLQWLNSAALTCPGDPNWKTGTACTTGRGTGYPLPIGRFGNAGVGSVVGPNYINLSSGISKSFSLVGNVKFRVQGTFNNVLNHTNLGMPNMNISTSSFGQITNTVGQTSSNADSSARTGQVSARLDF